MRWILSLFVVLFGLSATASDFRFSTSQPVIAFADVHGDYESLVALLKETGVIDGALRWNAGSQHVVSLGDLVDRGARSREVLDLLMDLQVQAQGAGGRLHVLLGNHEVMNLSRELDYVAAGEFASYADFDPTGAGSGERGHAVAFSSTAPYGSWLLERPFSIVVNDTLFVHAGLGEVALGANLDVINEQSLRSLREFVAAREALVRSEAVAPTADFAALRSQAKQLSDGKSPHKDEAERLLTASAGPPFRPEGPVWYRGNALCHPFYEQQTVEQILDQIDARRMVLGHSVNSDKRVHSRMEGQVILLDTGMNREYYRGVPAALIIDGSRMSVDYVGIADQPPIASTNRTWDRPFGLSDAQLEDFLATAEVVQVEDLGTGVTNPKRLTLRKDGRELRAVFKYLDTDPELERGRWERLADKADRYQNDYLAYRIDRLVGLDMVPVAVLREVDGKPGAVQLWVEDSVTESERKEQELDYQGYCPPQAQFDLMDVFDALIYNEDRNLGNVLYTTDDWKLWLIDHTRAFRSDKRIPGMYRKSGLNISPQLRERLRAIDEQALAEIAPLLHPRQMDALIARAEQLADWTRERR